MTSAVDNNLQFSLNPDSLEIEPTAQGGFTVGFARDGVRVDITLSREQLLTLARACRTHIPAFAPELEQADRELTETHRRLAHGLSGLSDSDWRHLLREIPSTTLLAFLWFMKDPELIKRVLGNLSQRAAEMMLDDLEATWGDRDPDQAPEATARQGREAVEAVVAAWRQLQT